MPRTKKATSQAEPAAELNKTNLPDNASETINNDMSAKSSNHFKSDKLDDIVSSAAIAEIPSSKKKRAPAKSTPKKAASKKTARSRKETDEIRMPDADSILKSNVHSEESVVEDGNVLKSSNPIDAADLDDASEEATRMSADDASIKSSEESLQNSSMQERPHAGRNFGQQSNRFDRKNDFARKDDRRRPASSSGDLCIDANEGMMMKPLPTKGLPVMIGGTLDRRDEDEPEAPKNLLAKKKIDSKPKRDGMKEAMEILDQYYEGTPIRDPRFPQHEE